jgi:hypothetical protein
LHEFVIAAVYDLEGGDVSAQARGMKTPRRPRTALVPVERIERTILRGRGVNVMLDADLAALYGVATRELVQAVKRNADRFPADFMFQLTPKEAEVLRSQTVISKVGRGGRRTPPYAFTEQGVAMLSSVLNSPRAVRVNIEIIRAFVRLRQMLESNTLLAKKLNDLERKYDAKFSMVFQAIRELMAPSVPRRRIGFASAHISTAVSMVAAGRSKRRRP